MNPAKATSEKLMAWHNLRRKVLTKEPLTDQEYKMIGLLLAYGEGIIYPSIDQITNYKRMFDEMASSEVGSNIFKTYTDALAKFEKRYLHKLNRS